MQQRPGSHTQAERGREEVVDEVKKRSGVVLPSLSRRGCGTGQDQRALLTSPHFQKDPGSVSSQPRARQAALSSQRWRQGLFLLPVTLCLFFFKGNSAVGGENEQAANERAAAALCQACETLPGAQLDAVGGWTPFIFTLELFSSHPVCSVLFISESVHPLSDGLRCRMRPQTFPVKANFRIKTDGGGGGGEGSWLSIC